MIQDARARIRNLIGGEDKLSKSEPNLLLPRTDEYKPADDVSGDKEQVLSSDTLDSGIFDDVIIDVADLAEDRNRLESQLERMNELLDENEMLKAKLAESQCLQETLQLAATFAALDREILRWRSSFAQSCIVPSNSPQVP